MKLFTAVIALSSFSIVNGAFLKGGTSSEEPRRLAADSGPPDFVAELDSLKTVPFCCADGGGHECTEASTGRGKTGYANFWISKKGGEDKIVYEIVLPGLDVDGWVSKIDSSDDVTKIHLHNNEAGVAGPHALNVLKAPCQDDFDLVLTPFENKISGIWDAQDLTDSDLCPGVPPPGQSLPLGDMLPELCAGNIYVNVHTNYCEKGELRGQAEPVTGKAAAFCANL